jgi:streptomycin 6-kinase
VNVREPIPDDFVRRITTWQEVEGAAWLRRLPGLISVCEREWSVTVAAPFPNLTFNYVAPALRADGTRAVLKIGLPHSEFLREMETLRICNGEGMVTLLEASPDRFCMLLERLEPGTSLLALTDDEEATSIAASVMKRLWRPAPPEHHLSTVHRWFKSLRDLRVTFAGGTGPLPASTVGRAEELYDDLMTSSAEPVLLHGDLHHDNILMAQREPWLAIDPKGLVGEPVFETGSWLRNWMPDLMQGPHPRRVLARRIDQFSEELGFERARIRDWAVAQAVLSACWSIEDNDDGWRLTITCADLLAEIN